MHNTRKQLSRQSRKFRAGKRNQSIRRVMVIVVSIAAFIFSISAVSRVQPLQIKTIEIIGADQEVAVSLRAAIYDALGGRYLKLFPKSNALIYPEDDVRESIVSLSPNIQTLKVERKGLQALVVSINEKTPAALVCAGLPDWNSEEFAPVGDSSCYFADKTGLLFEKAPSFSGSAYHRYYVPDLGAGDSRPVLGLQATSTAEFVALEDIYSTAEKRRMDVVGLLIKQNGEYELYIRNSVTNSDADASTVSHIAVVYFNNRRPLTEQLTNLVSFWTEMKDKARARRQTIEFDYIDVRYGSNVFYRELNP